jgi:asparagine synthase (glutamine-hydrolysing)
MCGICGVLYLDGRPVPKTVVERMAGNLFHRGPDNSGFFLDGGIGLGHTRLKIIDLSSAARQPMANEDETLWIVFNGEVYNYRELRGTLRTLGHTFRSNSDTEVVLHLYEEKGDRSVEDLDGMFAFALWDARRRRLLLARDRVGKKPVFYHYANGLFAFASEIKALLGHPSIPASVDQSAIPSYFLYGYVPTPASFYTGIYSLPPGHTLTVELDGSVRTRQYWDLSFSGNDGQDPALMDDRAAAGRVRELVTEAVRKRLVADVALGAFLSGGVDSSIVVGVMSQLMKAPVKTFSIGFTGDKAFDETRYARIVAEHFKTDHTEFIVEPMAVDLIETLVWHHDGPFGDPSGIPTYIVAQLTRERVTVTLNGDGGDELFAGYLRFAAGIMAEKIPASVMRGGNLILSLFPEPRSYHSPFRRARRFFQSAGTPFYERFSRWISLFYEDLEMLLNKSLLSRVNGTDRIAHFREHLEKISGYTRLSQLLYLNIKTYLLNDLLVKVDRTTMAHALEARSPFLDTELMEYAAALPDRMKIRKGRTKYILKKAFSDLLPPQILERGKMGFGIPLGTWFKGELREFIQDLLLSPQSRMREYLNPGYVAQLVREHLAGTRDHGQRLWAILTFEAWLRLLPQWGAASMAGTPRVRESDHGALAKH